MNEKRPAATSTERASLFSFVRRCREWWLTTGSAERAGASVCEGEPSGVSRSPQEEVVVIEPTSRLRAVEGENSRLRRTLEAIAEQGDKHNGEFVRLARREGEPESWAARRAYFALHPERQDGRNA